MAAPTLDAARKVPLLFDGGIGTLLQNLGAPLEGAYELLNLSDPNRVQEVHKRFIAAGAQVITTNTFRASGHALSTCGAADQVREINRKGVRLAREIRELMGTHVLIAGSVGPIGEFLASSGLGKLSVKQAEQLYKEQIGALIEGGADLILLETFSDLTEALLAMRVARTTSDLPVLVSLTFDDDGRTALGQTAAEVALALQAAGANGFGTNCGTGPRAILSSLRQMADAAPTSLLLARPNAGLPQRVQNRYYYGTTPQYAAQFATDALEAGARLIGGCCGMTPDHIAAMAQALQQAVSLQEASVNTVAHPDARVESITVWPTAGRAPTKQPKKAANLLGAKLQADEFVISIEMHPPRTHLTGAFLRAARTYKEAGVELVNLVDSPMARVRMDSLAACALIQERVGLETIAHVTPRDRTLLGLQGSLIGAHALGVRSILCVTGDPHRGHFAPGTINVYDVDAIGIMRLLAGYNRGVDMKGSDIGQPTQFLIGGALNPNAPDLGLEVERFHKKLEAGMEYAMVQPVFDLAVLTDLLDRLGRPPIPIIAGICPIHSYQHALLLHNEIPGITLTEPILARMRLAEANGEQEGVAIAQELLAAAQERCQGVYIMPSYGRHETALKVLEAI
jgi:methionine synthase I (cobalamin-dependent)/5,10-methylenetetrahydrofolate reductase